MAYYAPDPSSQVACSIGGNVAENSGGVHCLKYGLTVHNVLGVRGYTMEGDLLELGAGRRTSGPGPAGAHHRVRGPADDRHRGDRELIPRPPAPSWSWLVRPMLQRRHAVAAVIAPASFRRRLK